MKLGTAKPPVTACGVWAMPPRKRRQPAAEPAQPQQQYPLRAFADSVGAMQGWLGRHGDLQAALAAGGGVAQLREFLPPDVAEAALSQLQRIPEARWQLEEERGAGGHSFCACDQEGATVVADLARALWVARPQALPSFSALRLSAGHHIGRCDDRAMVEVMAADGQPAVFSRAIGAVYFLSKDHPSSAGGQFVDLAAADGSTRFEPLFNSLLLYEIPRAHEVSAVRGVGSPLFAMHGWWMAEGELYEMDSDDDDEAEGESDDEAAEAAGGQRQGPAAGTRSAVASARAAVASEGKGELANASMPAPLPPSLLPAEWRTGRRSASATGTISAAHAQAFQRDGLLVVDDALPLSWARSVQDEVAALEQSGAMAATQQEAYGVRQDKVVWLTADTAPPSIRLALACLTSVAHSLNTHLGLELLAPEAAMTTCYDGDGSHFIVHRDNTCDAATQPGGAGAGASGHESCINAREVTAIVYANTDWELADGGALRCHVGADPDDDTGETARRQRDVAPLAGRLVVFRSRELLHEVLPSHSRRLAISLWLLDGALPLRGD